jgi:hypothetical protein
MVCVILSIALRKPVKLHPQLFIAMFTTFIGVLKAQVFRWTFPFGGLLWLSSGLCDRSALYCLSNTSSPFCSGYIRDRVLLFAQAGMDHDPSVLYFLL